MYNHSRLMWSISRCKMQHYRIMENLKCCYFDEISTFTSSRYNTIDTKEKQQNIVTYIINLSTIFISIRIKCKMLCTNSRWSQPVLSWEILLFALILLCWLLSVPVSSYSGCAPYGLICLHWYVSAVISFSFI